MSEKKINTEQVRHVAALSRLALTDEETAIMENELNAILKYTDELNKLDVSNVEPTYHAVPVDAPLRKDELGQVLQRTEALAAAPQASEDCFAVPKVLEVEQ